jgi:hypothetical protein
LVCGTYDLTRSYRKLAFVAYDAGDCPGDGFQLLECAGKAGDEGLRGLRGERGDKGERGEPSPMIGVGRSIA